MFSRSFRHRKEGPRGLVIAKTEGGGSGKGRKNVLESPSSLSGCVGDRTAAAFSAKPSHLPPNFLQLCCCLLYSAVKVLASHEKGRFLGGRRRRDGACKYSYTTVGESA